MRRLRLAEYRSGTFDPLPPTVRSALAASRAVTVSEDRRGRTVLKASSKVGVLRVGDVELRIVPKVPIHRVMWLLEHATQGGRWHDDQIVTVTEVPDEIVTAVAVSLVAAARRAFAQGVLRGYQATEEALPLMRGRLREADQVRHRLAAPVPLEVRYDDFTIDTPENRRILAAVLHLLRAPGLPDRTANDLRELRSALVGVTPPRPGARVADPIDPPRQYRDALRLARIALAGQGIDQPEGPVRASGFLFDMNLAYQDWLAASLTRALLPAGGRLGTQFTTHIDVNQRLGIRPDMVWFRASRPVGVLDAKYKEYKAGKRSNADLYQMLIYCSELNLPEGHLVYASGTADDVFTMRTSGRCLRVWCLDLSLPIPDLRAAIGRIATALNSRESMAGSSS